MSDRDEWDQLFRDYSCELEVLAGPRVVPTSVAQLRSGRSDPAIGAQLAHNPPARSISLQDQYVSSLIHELFGEPEQIRGGPSVETIDHAEFLNMRIQSDAEPSSSPSSQTTRSREMSSPQSDLGVHELGRVSKPKPRGSRRGPSRFCHICWSGNESRMMIACKNLNAPKRSCRKVVCERCALRLFPDMKPGETNVACPHCRGICPQKSQCSIYKATNERRRVQKYAQGHSECPNVLHFDELDARPPRHSHT
eukprot:CAMPEP_0185848682 /NCGR_PEP_ID=MMETSP1354-20130828/3464_1 /TAXON_ID=708628 /ORGANISM="Erythrolobus madagascarensis, Strain CCMP3276" /LENGTH=251 /DNA_ID=CAMNT_0028549099 /DNA_START=78 /DNA_END=833 /DNA_ORIENTATION=+